MKWRGCHEPDESGVNSTINSEEDDAAASMCMPPK